MKVASTTRGDDDVSASGEARADESRQKGLSWDGDEEGARDAD